MFWRYHGGIIVDIDNKDGDDEQSNTVRIEWSW